MHSTTARKNHRRFNHEIISHRVTLVLTVGVTHEPMARACRNGISGTSPQMRREVASHIATMIGPRRMERGRHCVFR